MVIKVEVYGTVERPCDRCKKVKELLCFEYPQGRHQKLCKYCFNFRGFEK